MVNDAENNQKELKEYIADLVDFMFEFYGNTHTYLNECDRNMKEGKTFLSDKFKSFFYDKCENDQVNMGQHIMAFEYYHKRLFGEDFHEWNKKRWDKKNGRTQ